MHAFVVMEQFTARKGAAPQPSFYEGALAQARMHACAMTEHSQPKEAPLTMTMSVKAPWPAWRSISSTAAR
jgi:hypothetical protein